MKIRSAPISLCRNDLPALLLGATALLVAFAPVKGLAQVVPSYRNYDRGFVARGYQSTGLVNRGFVAGGIQTHGFVSRGYRNPGMQPGFGVNRYNPRGFGTFGVSGYEFRPTPRASRSRSVEDSNRADPAQSTAVLADRAQNREAAVIDTADSPEVFESSRPAAQWSAPGQSDR
ncbi:hypothetical protein Pan189_09870 [Stratiformator vulcanicus]|uniref:Uncharacterized protein n=1 Tax=Stratiformator vulcanicus TaxID=2527980 RepID=A0A517QYA4_9PLAN|nr:hypothetical protein Pan189_09870 [Stratiformator vulcanicus]